MDSFFNEDSAYCVLPTSFTDYHVQLTEDQKEEGGDITKNIPGMPNANKKEGLTSKNNTKTKENKEVTPEDVQSALDVISKQNNKIRGMMETIFIKNKLKIYPSNITT